MKPIFRKLNQNKTEAAYDEVLRRRQLVGEIEAYRFEPMSLIISHNVPGKRNALSYKPDFLVVTKEAFEFHEVKGFMRSRDLARMKAAAEMFPWFKFIIVRWEKKTWTFEEM